MKRWGLSAALVASLALSADVASAQRVTLKPAPEKTSAEKDATSKKEAEKKAEAEPEKAPEKAEAEPKKEPAKPSTTRKTPTTAKPNADSGILTPPPTSPRSSPENDARPLKNASKTISTRRRKTQKTPLRRNVESGVFY